MASSSSSSPEYQHAHPADPPERFSYKHATYEEVLEDISSRFILNLPDEELASVERICFQVEQAHWFYEDFVREENPKFPSLPLKKFSAMLFHSCPLLQQWSHDHEHAFNTFMDYKTRVPVCGAIMLNSTWEKCVLVKGWKSSSGWGFPKGKINQDEPPEACAVREVHEETGYNLAGQIDPDNVIKVSIKDQSISLYIVSGIPEDYPFQTKTRKEISKIEWFKLIDLPTWKRNKAAPGKFYLISPFIGALKAFINEHKPHSRARKGRTDASKPHIQDRRFVNDYQGGSAPESSSQSSSVDNGDPLTPSPPSIEATPVVNGGVEEGAPMDPHFARLLSSLSLSVTKPTQPQPDAKMESAMSTHADQKRPIKANLAANDTALKQSSFPPLQSIPDSMYHPQSPLNFPSKEPSTPRSTETVQANSLHALSSPTFTGSAPTNPHSPVSVQTSVQSASAASIMTSPRRSSRRSSSTADITPYLASASAAPPSGKRLKQLALLETVADESFRSASRADNVSAFTPTASHRPIHEYPGPSVSVPPPTIAYLQGGPGRVDYEAQPNVAFGPRSNHQPSLQPLSQHGPHDDPFKVRPRTVSQHNPTALPPPQNQHQTQLLSLLSGSTEQGRPLPVPFQRPGNQSLQLMHGRLPTQPVTIAMNPPYGSVPGPRPQSQNYIPYPRSSGPMGGPQFDSTILNPVVMPSVPSTRFPPDHGQLLSILNSNQPMSRPPLN